MALFGSIATVRAQAAPVSMFAAAFSYLDELFRAESEAAARLRGLTIGETKRVELAGGAFALEQVYEAKARTEGFFESHRGFIDVQVIFEGEEWMEVMDVTRAVVRQPYQAERDLIVYEDRAGASLVRVGVGDAVVFYPADVHMPGLRGGGAGVGGLVRKTVIKVPMPGA